MPCEYNYVNHENRNIILNINQLKQLLLCKIYDSLKLSKFLVLLFELFILY